MEIKLQLILRYGCPLKARIAHSFSSITNYNPKIILSWKGNNCFFSFFWFKCLVVFDVEMVICITKSKVKWHFIAIGWIMYCGEIKEEGWGIGFLCLEISAMSREECVPALVYFFSLHLQLRYIIF